MTTPHADLHAAARTLLGRATLALRAAGPGPADAPPQLAALDVAEKAARALLAEALGAVPARDQALLAEALAIRLGAVQADLLIGRPIDCQVDAMQRADETRHDGLGRRELTLAARAPRRRLPRPHLRVV